MLKSKKAQKELADNARLLRAWKRWHAEQLQEALEGAHAAVLRRLMEQLKNLHNARALVDAVAAEDWSAVDANTRLIALHEVNAAIVHQRERAGQPPLDDPLPGAPENAFRMIRAIITQASA